MLAQLVRRCTGGLKQSALLYNHPRYSLQSPSFEAATATQLANTRTQPQSPSMHSNSNDDEAAGSSDATVVKVETDTPTVRLVRCLVQDPKFNFIPGQWVDFFIPGVQQIGGYSICSSLSQLHQHRTFDLAVRQSSHAPAAWVHSEACKVGANLRVRSGGTFILNSSRADRPSLFLAGGIGITALLGMLHELLERQQRLDHTLQAVLVYSVQTMTDVPLLAHLHALQKTYPHALRIQLHVTRAQISDKSQMIEDMLSSGNLTIFADRVGKTVLRKVTEGMPGGNSCNVYVCGPPQATDAWYSDLEGIGYSKNNVYYERWW